MSTALAAASLLTVLTLVGGCSRGQAAAPAKPPPPDVSVARVVSRHAEAPEPLGVPGAERGTAPAGVHFPEVTS